jgi:hypothetical protein
VRTMFHFLRGFTGGGAHTPNPVSPLPFFMTYAQKLKDPRWQKRRLEILAAQNFTCQWCGDTKSTLHVHHFVYTGDPWDAEDGDLATICESCHWLEHKRKKLSIIENALIDKFLDSWKHFGRPNEEHMSRVKWVIELVKTYG